MFLTPIVTTFMFFKITWGAHLMNCPRDQVKFEKIIGLRPSIDINGYLLHKREIYEPVTLECISKCSSNDNCFSFVIYYNISECHWYSIRIEGVQENQNVIDPNVVWFEKICLASNCEKLWIFERIPGTILIGNNIITLPNKVTRLECQQSCLNYTQISCKSAKFHIVDENSTETLGICTLSDTNRHLMPNSFRVSSYDEEYFESQCTNVSTNTFCAYEEYDKAVLANIDDKLANKTQAECENLCESYTDFNCWGYSLIPTDLVHTAPYLCLIHSENSKIHGPNILRPVTGAKLFEKARCLNITVSCTQTHITVNYQPEVQFNGKIYMSGYSENLECFVMGNGLKLIVLKIPLFGSRCGITEARSPNYLNRTLFSGTMILQYNSLIQAQGDRIIKVGCIFSNYTKIVLGTGVNFANSSFPNQGTTIVNSTAFQPTVEMRIIDLYTEREVSDTQVGQELQLVIEIKPADGPFDIWAGHLIAMTENGQDSILLLDDRGCPKNLNIFPGLVKVYNNETRKLTANFYAFKFTSSSVIRFSVIIQFCPTYCSPSNCGNNYLSNGKRKRGIEASTDTTIKELNKNQFDNKGKDVPQIPLEFILLVRNSKTVSNQLIYGENDKIWVAGYDPSTNEVCVDFSLLIGIIILWIATQMILITCGLLVIRRYKRHYKDDRTQSLEDLHKNFGLGFGNVEHRHVHWADN